MWKQSSEFGNLMDDMTECVEDGFHGELRKEVMRCMIGRTKAGNNFKPQMLYSFARELGIDGSKNEEILRVLSVAMEMFHQVASVLDDITDGEEEKGVFGSVDAGTASVITHQLLTQSDEQILRMQNVSDSDKVLMLKAFATSKVLTAKGQYADIFQLKKPEGTKWIDWYLETCSMKTNALMALPFSLAAIVAKLPELDAQAMYDHGVFVGTMHQIGDDFEDGIQPGKPVISYPAAFALDDSDTPAFHAVTAQREWDARTTALIRAQCHFRIQTIRESALQMLIDGERTYVASSPVRNDSISEGLLLKAHTRLHNRTSFLKD